MQNFPQFNISVSQYQLQLA